MADENNKSDGRYAPRTEDGATEVFQPLSDTTDAPRGDNSETEVFQPLTDSQKTASQRYDTNTHAQRILEEEHQQRLADERERRWREEQQRRAHQQRLDEQNAQRAAEEEEEETGPALLAGKFETQKTVVNLVILGILGGIVTGAVTFIVDQIVAAIDDNTVALGLPTAIIYGLIAAAVTIGVGFLYVPTDGTGNESLFSTAIVVFTIALVVVQLIWVMRIFDGSFDAINWQSFVAIAAIIAGGITASVAPSRVLAAKFKPQQNVNRQQRQQYR